LDGTSLRHLSYVALWNCLLTVSQLASCRRRSASGDCLRVDSNLRDDGIGGGLASSWPKNRPLPVPPSNTRSLDALAAPRRMAMAPPSVPLQYPPTMPDPPRALAICNTLRRHSIRHGRAPGAPPPTLAAPQAQLLQSQYHRKARTGAQRGPAAAGRCGGYPSPPYPPKLRRPRSRRMHHRHTRGQ